MGLIYLFVLNVAGNLGRGDEMEDKLYFSGMENYERTNQYRIKELEASNKKLVEALEWVQSLFPTIWTHSKIIEIVNDALAEYRRER